MKTIRCQLRKCLTKVLATILIASPVISLASTLFYLDESDSSRCIAKTLDFPSKKVTTVFLAEKCPSEVAWDAQRERIFFIQNDQLWLHRPNWAPSRIESVSKMPDLKVSPKFMLWVDKATGQPRIAYLFEAESEGIKIKVQGTGEHQKQVMQYKGKRLEALDEKRTPYIAICAQLIDGHWKDLESKATESEFGDASELGVLDCLKNEREMNLSDLLSRSTCAEGPTNCNIDLDDKTRKLFQGAEAYGSMSTAPGHTFVFAVQWGDGPHAVPPVYFCNSPCDKATKLREVADPQLSISIDKNYVVFATEYENSHPRVYDAKTGSLFMELPDARAAVWLPPVDH